MPKPGKKPAVADSWEDEDLSDDAPEESTPTLPQHSASTPSSLVEPPSISTTVSDTDFSYNWDTRSSALPSTTTSEGPSSAKRPEKTDAVARRMIAASLGLKAPKQTEEQKAYQKSIREQEKRRKEKEREEEKRQHELTEKAKAAVWDD